MGNNNMIRFVKYSNKDITWLNENAKKLFMVYRGIDRNYYSLPVYIRSDQRNVFILESLYIEKKDTFSDEYKKSDVRFVKESNIQKSIKELSAYFAGSKRKKKKKKEKTIWEPTATVGGKVVKMKQAKRYVKDLSLRDLSSNIGGFCGYGNLVWECQGGGCSPR